MTADVEVDYSHRGGDAPVGKHVLPTPNSIVGLFCGNLSFLLEPPFRGHRSNEEEGHQHDQPRPMSQERDYQSDEKGSEKATPIQ